MYKEHKAQLNIHKNTGLISSIHSLNTEHVCVLVFVTKPES